MHCFSDPRHFVLCVYLHVFHFLFYIGTHLIFEVDIFTTATAMWNVLDLVSFFR